MPGRIVGMLCLAAATGCTAPEAEPAGPALYLGSTVRQIGPDLVQIEVRMRGGDGEADLRAYADCVVSGLILRDDLGFARHLRTKTTEEGGARRADAVYTVSPTLPRGLRTIDAEAMAEACRENGIPMV